jgi:hypothetical protein
MNGRARNMYHYKIKNDGGFTISKPIKCGIINNHHFWAELNRQVNSNFYLKLYEIFNILTGLWPPISIRVRNRLNHSTNFGNVNIPHQTPLYIRNCREHWTSAKYNSYKKKSHLISGKAGKNRRFWRKLLAPNKPHSLSVTAINT